VTGSGHASLSTGVQTCAARCVPSRVESEALTEQPLLDVNDVADYLNVPVRWVYQRVQRKEIPHLRLGKHLRFQHDRLTSWLLEMEELR
jgi:excisionase family DNA binding protein